MGYAQRAVAQADSGGRQGDAHGSARGRRQLDRVQKRRAAPCAATAAQGAAHRLLLGGRGASGRRRSSAQERARVGAGAGTSRPTPCSPCFCSCSAARPRYDPRTPSCRQDERDERPSQDERTQRPAMAVLTAADGRAADRQASGRSGSLLPATASSTLDAVDAGQNSVVCCSAQLARRSAAQPGRRPPVSLGSQRSCRVSKGLQEGWLAVSGCRAEQRSTDQLMLSPPAHAEAAAARQPAGGPPPPAHAEAAAARPPPTDRPMDGGWTERGPSSATVVSAAPASGRQQQQPRAKDGDNCWPTGRQRG